MGFDSTTFTGRARLDFLRVLAATGNASKAARAVRMSLTTARNHRAADEAFAEQWEEALSQFHHDFEESLAVRAMHGVKEPLLYQGQFVRWPEDHPEAGRIAHVVKYSDSLGPVLLKAHDPERHRDRSDVRVKGTHRLDTLTDDELLARAATIIEDKKLRGEGERPDGVRDVDFVELPAPSPEDLI